MKRKVMFLYIHNQSLIFQKTFLQLHCIQLQYCLHDVIHYQSFVLVCQLLLFRSFILRFNNI